jgi:hypothetical protein
MDRSSLIPEIRARRAEYVQQERFFERNGVMDNVAGDAAAITYFQVAGLPVNSQADAALQHIDSLLVRVAVNVTDRACLEMYLDEHEFFAILPDTATDARLGGLPSVFGGCHFLFTFLPGVSIGGAASYLLWDIALPMERQLAEQLPTFGVLCTRD